MNDRAVAVKKVSGALPVIGMVLHMAGAILVSPFMGLLGIASLVNRWAAEQFGKTL